MEPSSSRGKERLLVLRNGLGSDVESQITMALHTKEVLLWVQSTEQWYHWYEFLAGLTGHERDNGPRGGGGPESSLNSSMGVEAPRSAKLSCCHDHAVKLAVSIRLILFDAIDQLPAQKVFFWHNTESSSTLYNRHGLSTRRPEKTARSTTSATSSPRASANAGAKRRRP